LPLGRSPQLWPESLLTRLPDLLLLALLLQELLLQEL
jgi:hypothetical protein